MIKGRIVLVLIFVFTAMLEQLSLGSIEDNSLKVLAFAPCFIFAASALFMLSGTFFGKELPNGEVAFREGSLMGLLINKYSGKGSLCLSFWKTVGALLIATIVLALVFSLAYLAVSTPWNFLILMAYGTGLILALFIPVAAPIYFLTTEFGMLFEETHPKLAKACLWAYYSGLGLFLVASPIIFKSKWGVRPEETYRIFGTLFSSFMAFLLILGMVYYLISFLWERTCIGKALRSITEKTCPNFTLE